MAQQTDQGFITLSHLRSSYFLWLLLGLSALIGCSSQPLIVLDLDNTSIPASAASLLVRAQLGGMDVPPAPAPIGSQQIAIYLPTQGGLVQLELDALDENNCKVAAAQVELGVPGGLSQAVEFPLSLNSFPGPLCTLTLLAQGMGMVTSVPSGIACVNGTGPGCTADFPTGTLLNLFAPGSVTPWSGCDSFTDTTCSLTLTKSRTASVEF